MLNRDWRHLKISVGGGAAIQSGIAKLGLEQTGCAICDGFGLSDTSPSVRCSPVVVRASNGTMGLPLPNTDVPLPDDAGKSVARGAGAEIAVKGPQTMAGYWQRPEEAAEVMTPHVFFKTGEAVKLVITKKAPSQTETTVRAYCKHNLAGYKQPQVVGFRAELPQTPAGKILRRELREH